MATDTKEETKPTDDLEFLDEVNYSYRKEYQQQRKRPPYAPHVIDKYDPNRESAFLDDPDIGPDQLKDTKQDDSYELWRDD